MNKILEKVPKDAMIASHSYEGANIVLYTKNKNFFLHGGDIVRKLVEDFKKRIELRADSSIAKDPETARNLIKKILPEDAQVTQIIMQPARSVAIIEAKKPGAAIGKDGENLRKIKDKTFWTPFIRRESVIPSKITTNIRNVLYENSDERRKFLNRVGKRIYETKRYSGEEMWARVTFLGAGRQVGRSAILLQTPESKVLLDCGVDVADEKHPYPYLTVSEFKVDELDAVIISHAHLDHCGLLPLLFKYGYNGPIYCTEPTRDVMAMLQLDLIGVSQAQGKTAPYTSTDIKNAVKNTVTLEYGEVTDITPDVRITLYNAGHILGSSLVHLHIGEGWHNLLYTGDFKYLDSRTLSKAQSTFPRVETLITESTYGGAENILQPRKKSEEDLIKFIQKILKQKGKVLLPVLGVGRAQEVMVIIEKYFREKKIKTPVYIDGMVWDVAALHNAYPRFLNKELREKIFYEDKDPFLSPIFKRVGSRKERQEVINGPPCVVLATSGMLVGGSSVEYLKNFAGDKKNGIVLTSYQGPGSLGRKIERGDKEVTLDNGDKLIVNLERMVESFTNHAGRIELMDFIKYMQPRPRKVIIVHGELPRPLDLASSIHKTFRIETVAPKNLETIRLR